MSELTESDLTPPLPKEPRPRSPISSEAWEKFGILGVLLLLVIVMALVAPNFVSIRNGLNVAQSVSINAVLAAGMTMVIITGGIDLSVGSLVAVSGVGTVIALNGGVNPVLAVLFGLTLAAVAGLVNGAAIAYLMLPPFIVTLGGLTYLRGVAYSFTDAKPEPIDGKSPLDFLGNGSLVGIPTMVIVMVITYAVFWFILERTRFGRHVYAVGGNAEAARLGGVKVRSVLVKVYVISGLTAGLAGIMFAARVRSGQVTAGEGYELDAITAVILGGTSLFGGKGHIFGTLVGALIMGVLGNGLILMGVPFYTQLIVKGAVVVLAVAIDYIRTRRTG